jgi:hypothetical protein
LRARRDGKAAQQSHEDENFHGSHSTAVNVTLPPIEIELRFSVTAAKGELNIPVRRFGLRHKGVVIIPMLDE